MNAPAITVLMPAYNAEKYIAEAIDSVLAQTFTDFEFLIVDDGSTDNTANIIKSCRDERIRYIYQPNQGVAAALNTGLAHASAELIARFDADDICYPGRLQQQYDFMQSEPEYHVVGSSADYVDEQNNFVFTYNPMPVSLLGPKQLLKVCPFVHSTVCFRRQTILEMGGYHAGAFAFEDHLLWIKVLKKYAGYNDPASLIRVRLNPLSVTVDDRWADSRFLQIKYRALVTGILSGEDSKALQKLRRSPDKQKIGERAYYTLLAKKFLWDNYNPRSARDNLYRLIRMDKLRLSSYMLLMLSWLPQRAVSFLYRLGKSTPAA